MQKNNSLNPGPAYGNFAKYWLPVLIYAILIFYLSSIPGGEIPQVFKFQDVLLHLVEYAVLAFLLSRAIKAHKPQLTFKRRFAVVFILSFLYALSDEIHQVFVPQRNCALSDLLYDSIGIAVADIFYR